MKNVIRREKGVKKGNSKGSEEKQYLYYKDKRMSAASTGQTIDTNFSRR